MHCIWQQCHGSESQRRLLKTASEKVDFLKQTLKLSASEESDLTSEIFNEATDDMSKEEFEIWLDIDNNAEVVATMTVSEICKAVADDKSKLAEESESNCTNKEEEILVAPPTNAQMREALRILRRGVQTQSNKIPKAL